MEAIARASGERTQELLPLQRTMALVRIVVVTMSLGIHVVANMLQSAVVAAVVVVLWPLCSLLLCSSSATPLPAAASMLAGPWRHMARITVMKMVPGRQVVAKFLQSPAVAAVVLAVWPLFSLLLGPSFVPLLFQQQGLAKRADRTLPL